jgi:hypothetical protein
MYSASTSLRKRPIAEPLSQSTESVAESNPDISAPLAGEEPVRRLNAARGVMIGLALGAGSWVAIFALIRSLKP